MTWLSDLGFWAWYIAAVLFILIEIALPGVVFLWLGIAAVIAGCALLLIPDLGWQSQFLIFAICAVVSVVVSRIYLWRRPIKTDRPTLNRRGEQYIGRRVTLKEPIVDGRGRIHVDDSYWKVEGPDLEAGKLVMVVESDGPILKVIAVK